MLNYLGEDIDNIHKCYTEKATSWTIRSSNPRIGKAFLFYPKLSDRFRGPLNLIFKDFRKIFPRSKMASG